MIENIEQSVILTEEEMGQRRNRIGRESRKHVLYTSFKFNRSVIIINTNWLKDKDCKRDCLKKKQIPDIYYFVILKKHI